MQIVNVSLDIHKQAAMYKIVVQYIKSIRGYLLTPTSINSIAQNKQGMVNIS